MTNANITPSQEYLKECFSYDHITGDLFWKARPLSHFKNKTGRNIFNGRYSGKKVGCIWTGANNEKYIVTNLLKINYRMHRLIWKLVYGVEPEEIDHINGNGCDNSLSNLRSVTKKENARNLKLNKSNTSGVSGVFWTKGTGKWKAQIKVNNKSIFIGHYDNKFDAICARKSAENAYSYHENHGRR